MMNLENECLIEKLKEDYKNLKSMRIDYDEDEDRIKLVGVRYRSYKNNATLAQVRYLQGFDNVKSYSTSNLLKANKWFMSACITIAKENPSVNFIVYL